MWCWRGSLAESRTLGERHEVPLRMRCDASCLCLGLVAPMRGQQQTRAAAALLTFASTSSPRPLRSPTEMAYTKFKRLGDCVLSNLVIYKLDATPRGALGSAGARAPCWVWPGSAWPPTGHCFAAAPLTTVYLQKRRHSEQGSSPDSETKRTLAADLFSWLQRRQHARITRIRWEGGNPPVTQSIEQALRAAAPYEPPHCHLPTHSPNPRSRHWCQWPGTNLG